MSVNDNAMKRWSGDDAWIEQYYQNSPVEDREVFSTEELEELARAHRALAETREPNTPAVTVHNDEYSTTLLVVTDDMGYLVSSLTAEIASDFGGVYSLFHPIFIVDRDPNGNFSRHAALVAPVTSPAAIPQPTGCLCSQRRTASSRRIP